MATKQTETRTLVNRKGQSLNTERTEKQAFAELERRVKAGEASDFAADLIRKGRKNGLSDEQFWWVHKLLEPVNEVEIPCGNINARMNNARDNGVKVRNLKVRFDTELDGCVQLMMAGPRSKYYRSIWVTDGGQYPENVLYGMIDYNTGVFKGRDVPLEIQALLREINDNTEAYLPW